MTVDDLIVLSDAAATAEYEALLSLDAAGTTTLAIGTNMKRAGVTAIVRALRDEIVEDGNCKYCVATTSMYNQILGSDAGEKVAIKETAVGAVLRLEAGDPPLPATDPSTQPALFISAAKATDALEAMAGEVASLKQNVEQTSAMYHEVVAERDRLKATLRCSENYGQHFCHYCEKTLSVEHALGDAS